MRGKQYIIRFSAAFLAGDMAASLLQAPLAGRLLPLIALLAILSAAATAIFRSRRAATAAFVLLGAISACTGGCQKSTGRLQEAAESAKATVSGRLGALAGGGREGAILSAIAIGDRSGIDRLTKQDFRASGAMHLIALSGLHIGVLYIFMSLTLGVLGRSRFGGTDVEGIRKAQHSFGWDIMPHVVCGGIWRGVSLVAWRIM